MDMELENKFRVVQDGRMGRCLESQKSFEVGTLLWKEKALVSSTFDEDEDDGMEMDEEEGGLAEAMEGLSRVQSLDTARNLLKLVKLSKDTCGPSALGSPTNPSRRLFAGLQATNLAECVQNISDFRATTGGADHFGLPDAEVGWLLGVLNSNQVELEVGGSGLFTFTAIIEHSCAPNCSFTTAADELYMCAIRPISPGDRLSIDYCNGFYRCASDRQTDLKETYAFDCSCHTCSGGPDRTRAFWCSVKVTTLITYHLATLTPLYIYHTPTHPRDMGTRHFI